MVTVADTAADREAALERATETLRRIRELLGTSGLIRSWAPSILRPVTVLVVGSPDWNDRPPHPRAQQRQRSSWHIMPLGREPVSTD